MKKAGIGYYQENVTTTDLCYLCGKIGHPTTEYPIANNVRNRNTSQVYKRWPKNDKRNWSRNMLPSWANKDLIHPFYNRKGPKLV